MAGLKIYVFILFSKLQAAMEAELDRMLKVSFP